jgi:HSP20 family protein
MFGYIGDLDRTLGLLTQFRHQMQHAFDDLERGGTWYRPELPDTPAVNLYDTGSAFVITAEVPGIKSGDLQINLNRDVISIAGERPVETPEGYSVHRRERAGVRFSRSFALPAAVNPDRVEATLRDGVLTVRVEKADEIKPRTITVKTT